MKNIKEFLAVYSDSSFKLFLSKQEAKLDGPLFIARAFVYSDFPTLNDPDRKKYGFNIFDVDDKEYFINCNGWKITDIKKYFFYESHTEIRIAAPNGEVRMVDTNDDCSNLESIAKLQSYINEFRSFKDWSYYELKMENLSLKKEIELLKFQIDE